MTRKVLTVFQDAAPHLLPVLIALAVASCLLNMLDQHVFGQNVEGQIVASQYGQWQLQGTQANSFVFSPAVCQVKGGNNNFSALKQGVPLRIVDPGNSALDETLVAGLVNIHACSVQLLPVNMHYPPFYLTSGTAGLQEAINANQTTDGPNSILLSADWYKQGGSAEIIASVTGIQALSLVDITTTPYTWYEWNGSQYAAVPVGGGSPGGASGAFQYNSGGAFAGTTINGLVKGNGTSAPSAAVPGTDYQPPTNFSCSGGISCPQVGNEYNFTSSGAAGSGNVLSQSLYADGSYQSAGATIGSQGNSFTVPNRLSASQMQSAINAQSATTILHINGPEFPFTNPSNFPVVDNRPGASTWSVTNSGAACNTVLAFGTVAAGSNVLNLVSGYDFATTDPGDTGTNLGAKWISMVGTVSGVPTRFDAYITSVTNAVQATLSASAPFSVTDYSITIGNDDTAALTQAVSYAHNGVVKLTLPSSGFCWSRTAPVTVNGESLGGQSQQIPLSGGLLGGAGFDTLFPDGGAEGQEFDHFAIYLDARINATQPWNFDNNGTTTAQTPLYRPAGLLTPMANNPLGPGWIRGSEPTGYYAFNGVAATAAGSAVMCVLTAANSVPPIGADILFPYMTNIVHTTVASTAGTCATGTPITLSSSAGLQTVSQAEYFFGEAPSTSASGTAVQEIETAIPATGRSFPMQISLANTIQPEPQVETDVSPYGVVKIDGEEFQYYGTSSYPAQVGSSFITLTAGAQNGTSATAHSVEAAIVPLNPCYGRDMQPWPVTTINGAGNQTPPHAEYFPAWCLGNAAISQAVYDGSTFTSGSTAFYRAHVHDLQIATWPTAIANSAENPYNFQVTNSTVGFYTVPLPFATKFENIDFGGAQFGIFEAGTSINTHNFYTVVAPTADTDTWNDLTINAGYDFDFLGGSTGSYTNFQMFSSNGPPNVGWPGYPPAVFTGAGTGGLWSSFGIDDTVGLGQGQYSSGSECYDSYISNIYLESEDGPLVDTQPTWVFDCNTSTWSGQGDTGGGTIFISGTGNHLSGGPFVSGPTVPTIVNASDTTIDYTYGLTGAISNVWGSSPLLSWGPENNISGQSSSPDGRISYGNNTPVVSGQTNETFESGNITAPFVNSQAGFFLASRLTVAPQLGTPVGWTFDNTPANITQGYVGCSVQVASPPEEGGPIYCTGYTGSSFGPGQALAATKYIVTVGLRQNTAAAQTVNLILGTSCGYLDQSHIAIPISSTWTNVQLGIEDFSGTSGCSGPYLWFRGTSTTAASVDVNYISFVPLPQNLTSEQFSMEDGSTWTSGSTTPTGSCTAGSIYTNTSGTPNTLYVCQSGSWVGK